VIRFAWPSSESGYQPAGLVLVHGSPWNNVILVADPDKGSVLTMEIGKLRKRITY
jgi:hypothetical protein